MAKERLIYLPLGGAGEVGMNCYVYGYGPEGRERLIVVDLGVTFPDMDTTPGVGLILPDIEWLVERRDRIEAIFFTHAHEDHIGALGHLWESLRAPVHARAFTAGIGRIKLEECGIGPETVTTVSAWPETVRAGPFDVGMLPVSHSIPESSALVIDTPAGRILHTGDFKLDATPVVGDPFDRSLWKEVAASGVRALVCDSTNVLSPNPGRSEASIVREVEDLMSVSKGMVAATTFASNIARLKTLAEAGHKAGRSVVLLGRAMRRMVGAAKAAGVLERFPGVVAPEVAEDIPREHLLLLVTGSQGERRAASAKLSQGRYLGFELKEGDTFLFSSKTIPGNERDVIRIMNRFSERGVEVIGDATDNYHVSGHANRPDLEEMHALVDPEMVIPMHGEHRMLSSHARLAERGGRSAVVATNGAVVDISGSSPEVIERIEVGRTYLDGSVLVDSQAFIVRDRIRMALNGHVYVDVRIGNDGEKVGAWSETRGLAGTGRSGEPLDKVLDRALTRVLVREKQRVLADDEAVDTLVRSAARKTAMAEIGKKPEVTVAIDRDG
ncbi:MAG: ribonuclease J [Rhodobacter sp.]|nr:ribonuclease J [Rhodobacter sp.]MCY4167263.1 ribonuclease J [Rhodobacter sp.]